MTTQTRALGLIFSLCTVASRIGGAPRIAADWGGDEPAFPPGSLYWHTDRYKTCPVIFRTILRVGERPIASAGFQARVTEFAHVYVNGRQVAAAKGTACRAEFAEHLRPGQNVLAISTGDDGFALMGSIGYEGGEEESLPTSAGAWRAMKFPPLTMLELEPSMGPDFDASGWFRCKEIEREGIRMTAQEIRSMCADLIAERLSRRDGESRWRLKMLAEKGIAIADDEARGWGGRGRLPRWILDLAGPLGAPDSPASGSETDRAEALCRHVLLCDEAVNLENLSRGLAELGAPADGADACRAGADKMRSALAPSEAALRRRDYRNALSCIDAARTASDDARRGRLLNRLNECLDNKFSWFDTTEILDSDPARWGIRVESQATVYSSPLSPASLVTVEDDEVVLAGWDAQSPLRVYDRDNPRAAGPVCLWAFLGGGGVVLRPEEDGTVYDAPRHGKPSENWVLLVHDMTRGGHLPIQIVFLNAPARIAFEGEADKGARAVRIAFGRRGAQFFILRPFQEWRGFLAMAQDLTQYPGKDKAGAPARAPLDMKRAARHLTAIRLWSRAVLDYPIAFSEAVVPDPADKWSLLVADIYNYQRFADEWSTDPRRMAPLPPLATYGLMTNYPGLACLGKAERIGSRGIWGDLVAVMDRDIIAYRVPLHRIKRFGGFTSYCFGGTDIGGPGSEKEIETIRRTGANSFRPQHNQTGAPAMRTAAWCREQGIQNVFNADEKWVPDIVEHYRILAGACRDFPPDAIAYDLLNEPETRDPIAYGVLLKKITAAIREVDKTHLIYAEAMPAWGPGAKPFPRGAFETLPPTGDGRTVYSFHDYEFRLGRVESAGPREDSGGSARWPNERHDIRDLLARWIPAFRYSIDQRAPIHLGEFGGYEQVRGQDIYEDACALTMMMDHFRIFDQFGWHWHYYSNRGTIRVREDGSIEESYIQKAARRYFRRGTFNAHWPE